MKASAARIRRRIAMADDAGFTLVEMVAALLMFTLVAQGLAAALIGSARSQLVTRFNTGAKNFAQERVDAMRSMPFHVDAQNGPYVDLLDLYYSSASGTRQIPNIVQGQTVTGTYSALGGSGGPAGPYYKVTIPGNLISTQLAPYTQVVYTQFLNPNKAAATALAASAIPATYDNTVVGHDQPPSPIVGLTIVTSWTSGGSPHSLSTFTEITSQGTDTSLVVSQAKAAAVRVLTQDYNTNAITASVGSVTANGSVSQASQAGAEATGADVSYTDPTTAIGADLTGAQQTAVTPPQPAGTTGVGATATQEQVGTTSNCGWASFSPTQVSDVSATSTSALPIVPSNGNATPSSPQVSASLQSNGGGPCSGLWFNNQLDTDHPADPALGLSATSPMVAIEDIGGGLPEVTGSANLYATATYQAPGAIAGTASTSMATWLKVFPGLPFLTNTPGGAGYPAGTPGLVNVKLTSASLSCASAPDGTTTASLSYTGVLAWFTYDTTHSTGVWHSSAFTWPTSPLASIDLNQPVNGTGTTLSTYIASITPATTVTDSNGVHSVEAALAIATVPTLAGLPGTALNVELGHMSCVAQDNR